MSHNQSKYKPGERFQVGARTITIEQVFLARAKDRYGEAYNDWFYFIRVYPENKPCVIEEFELETGIIQPYIPTIGRYGAKGNINHKMYGSQFKIWRDMIYRCYYSNNSLYKAFGGAGAYTDTKWLCFEYFMYDWDIIPGAQESLLDKSTAHVIDFNTATANSTDRRYCAENCIITTFGGSQVAYVYNSIKREKELMDSVGCPLKPIPPHTDFYHSDHGFVDKPRGINTIEREVKEEVRKPFDDGLKEMATIIDKKKKKKNKQDKDKK